MMSDQKIRKIFWNDIETGGVNPKTDAILQIAFIIDLEGEEIVSFNSFVKPFNGAMVSDEALKVTGIKREDIDRFPDAYSVYHEMRKLLDAHGYKKQKAYRYVPAGYNNQFDLEFLLEWMTQIDSKFAFWDFLQMTPIDPLPILRALRFAGILPIQDTKLSTVCEYLRIPLAAHDALSDIRATKIVTERLYTKIFKLWTGKEYRLLGPSPFQKDPA